jgi:GAF domain-containing protein/HAMP domain-containing protein
MEIKTPSLGRENRLTSLIKKTGKYYLSLAIAIAQLPFFPAALVGAIIVQINANYANQQFFKIGIATSILLIIGYLIVIIYGMRITRKANQRLGEWAQTGILVKDRVEEVFAWREVTTLPTRFGVFVMVIVLFFEISLVNVYQYFFLNANSDQVVYSFLGGLVPGITVIILSMLILEQLLIPVRDILLPSNFEDQLKGSSNSYIFSKFLMIGLGLILITTLLIAPIGYRQTFKAIYETIGSIQLFNELRIQLIVASILAMIIGIGLTLMLSRSVTKPIDLLIQTFIKVENGSLSERARILTTDEIGELSIYFNRMISRLEELQQTLENKVFERTEQLRVSNEVGRIATTILDPDTVIEKVVNLITESFNYYYAAIFLINEDYQWAELKSATGIAGKHLTEQKHKLPIDKNSMVGNAILTREPQVSLDVGESPMRFDNPLLPKTRSEIAIPLIVGVRVIGALDVQSIREGDFRQEVTSTLESMANQVAIAIENARLFKEMNQVIEELNQTNRQNLLSSWSDKLLTNKLDYTTGSSLNQSQVSANEIEVKLKIRDEGIGFIRMQREENWSKEDQAWVEALATQVSISLENARFIEESQQAAFRDRLAASITQKIWSSNSVEGILQTTIQELGRALDASDATIILKVDE